MLAKFRRLYVPLFTQITIPFIMLALVVAAGGVYIVTRLIFDSLEDRFTSQLVETAVLAQDSIVRVEEDLLVALRLAGNIQGVDAALSERRAEDLQTLVLPAAYNEGTQALVFVDRAGVPVLSLYYLAETQAYEPLVFSQALASHPFVRSVLTGEIDDLGDKFVGIASTERGEMLFVSGPVTDGAGQRVGAVLVGMPVLALASQVRSETVSQVSLYASDGRVLASTFSQPADFPAEQAMALLAEEEQSGLARSHIEGGANSSELVSPWRVRGSQDLGLVGVSLSTNFLVQASQFSRQNTLLFMLGMLMLVVGVGLVVARGITNPINRLKEAAQQVSRGNLRVRVPQGAGNEIGVLNDSFNLMVSNLNASKQDLLDAYDKTIEGWAKATDMRDHETEGHSRRVTQLAVALSKAMGFKGADLVHIYRGALLHDIGKIAIPDSILLKPGKLTPEERLQMQRHTEVAEEFMSQIDFLKPALAIPASHHEKWDGTGYPRGLRGEQIPLQARIFAVVDVWDALTFDRPYRKALSFNETMEYIVEQSGRHFDPAVAIAFKKMMGR